MSMKVDMNKYITHLLETILGKYPIKFLQKKYRNNILRLKLVSFKQ